MLKTMADEMPGYATARVLLARSYEGLGEWGGALTAWREAMQIVPNSPVILRGLERVARKAASGASSEELPSVSVSTPASAWAEPDEADAPTAPDVRLGVDERDARDHDVDRGDEVDRDHEVDRDLATEPEPEYDPEPEYEREPEYEQDLENVRGLDQGADLDSPEDPEDPGEDPEEDRDLDRLISELESARIVPRPDLDTLPEPELDDDIEDVVSVTLARIYASQGQYQEAARVYDLLAVQQPDDEAAYKAKAEEMRSKASEE